MYTGMMGNPMEKKIENEMEARVIQGFYRKFALWGVWFWVLNTYPFWDGEPS